VARLAAALRLEPGNTRVHNNLGVIAYEQGHLPAAYKYLDYARQIEDHMEQFEPETRNHLAVVLSSMGKIEESWEEFQRAGKHERAEFEVWYNMGRAYVEVGKPDRGVSYLRQAFQANPQHPMCTSCWARPTCCAAMLRCTPKR
jgi:Tfp pilus assembly protein PilF